MLLALQAVNAETAKQINKLNANLASHIAAKVGELLGG